MSKRGMYGTQRKPRSPINKRKLAALGVVVIILGGVLFLYNFGLPAKSFHSEQRFSQDISKTFVMIGLGELHDCILNVSFVDDPDLIYEIDIELSEPSFASEAFELTFEDNGYYTSIGFSGAIIRTTATRVLVREVQLVLGSAVPYTIGVSGENVTSTITYGNNMVGSDSYLSYRAEGPYLALAFTEEMVFSDTGMEVSISGANVPSDVYLDVDLVSGVHGRVSFDGNQYLHENTGWTKEPAWLSTIYSTDPSDPEPLLSIFIQNVFNVHLWLMD